MHAGQAKQIFSVGRKLAFQSVICVVQVSVAGVCCILLCTHKWNVNHGI